MSNQNSKTVATLAYAAAPSQFGVVVEQSPAGARVIVPRLQGWQLFFNRRWASIVFSGSLTGILVSIVLTEGWRAVLSTRFLILFPGVFVGMLGYELFTMWRRRVFLVTPDDVSFGFIVGTREMWQHRWAREEIGEIKMNPYDGKLLIRITGKDMQEYVISSNRDITRVVADTLNTALHLGTASR